MSINNIMIMLVGYSDALHVFGCTSCRVTNNSMTHGTSDSLNLEKSSMGCVLYVAVSSVYYNLPCGMHSGVNHFQLCLHVNEHAPHRAAGAGAYAHGA